MFSEPAQKPGRRGLSSLIYRWEREALGVQDGLGPWTPGSWVPASQCGTSVPCRGALGGKGRGWTGLITLLSGAL